VNAQFGKIFCIFRREVASMTNLNPGDMETTSSFTSKTKEDPENMFHDDQSQDLPDT
jgi:hypothetical protein